MMTLHYYVFGSDTSEPPLGDQAPWDEELARAAASGGINPDDDETVISQLSRPWRGYPAGSRVVLGLTVEGYPFAIEVTEPATITDERLDDLMAAATLAGDEEVVAACERALNGDARARRLCAEAVAAADREFAYQADLEKKAGIR